MAYAHAALPRLDLDAKRIAATTLAIGLHVGVLMMLLAPVRQDRPASGIEEPDMIVVPTIKPKPIDPPPKPKPIETKLPPPLAPPQHVQAQDPPIEPVDQTVGAMDFASLPDDTSASSFDTGPVGPSFVQLATVAAPAPVYPRPAIARRMTGTVILRIQVDAAGRPMQVSIEESSGHAILDQAALKVVKSRWRFVPATQDGVAVEAWARVPIEFVLQ